MLINKFALFGIAFILLISLYINLQPAPEISQIQSKKMAVSPPTSTVTSSGNVIEKDLDASCTSEKKSLTSTTSLRSIQANDLSILFNYKKAKENPLPILQAARKGDASAAMAAFALLRNCSPIGDLLDAKYVDLDFDKSSAREFCKAISNEILMNPLLVLREAIHHGSNEAKLIYAKNASALIKFNEFSHLPNAKSVANEIARKAEEYGADAANAGIEEAYSFMATSYKTGLFGQKDSMKAYAYTLALTKFDQSDILKERLDFLYKDISLLEARKAEKIAFGCKSVQEKNNSVLLSPF